MCVEAYLRHCEFESVIRHRVRCEDQCLKVQLLVAEDLPESLPVVLLILLTVVGGLRTTRRDVHELQETCLVGFQPASRTRRIGQQKEAADTDNYREDAFEQEDPSPSLVATDASHLCDSSSEES